ncbi:MAG TPA: RNA polymerase sigma-54 factor [Planctomycetaceae bacterium]|nr:RNA polymerase sigma-54 factor [Planctomycetaceae bacterium]
MRFSFGQELRQEQKQVLSQRMIQSMEILQLTLQQLEERVELELEDNPLLEIGDGRPEDATPDSPGDIEWSDPEEKEAAREAEEERIDAFAEHEHEIDVHDSGDNRDDFRIAEEFSSLYADTIDEAPARSQNWLEEAAGRHGEMIAAIPTREETLPEYLIDQLSWFDLDRSLRAMIERIVYNLDRHGFFTESLEEFLGLEHDSKHDPQRDPRQAEEELHLARKALEIVRRLDPVGVGCPGVRECLLMQIDNVDNTVPLAEELRILVSEHFEDIRHNRLPHIAKQTGFSLARIQEAIKRLRYLNPYPAAGFRESGAPTVTPDVVLEKTEEGDYVVHVENGRIPPLRISAYYRDMLKNKGTDQSAREYIRQKNGSAQLLIDAILHRKSTLRKVAQAIVDHQTAFFETGPEAIKPLKMQQIADAVGVHVTTVSRTCDEKWMQTPLGLFPLKRFFTGSVSATGGEEELASDVVRSKLREIVEKEDKKAPLSDEDLVRALESAGIKIARRTVVKYRQAMNIPSSRVRRTW